MTLPPVDMRTVLKDNPFVGAFEQSLLHDLPFTIPCLEPRSLPFSVGKAEYGHVIDTWLDHLLPCASSEMSICGMDGNWFTIIDRVVDGSDVSVNLHHMSSKAKLRPDGVFTVRGSVAGIVESKADKQSLSEAERELSSKFHPLAHKQFPLGHTSIPGFTTCATDVRVYSINYSHNTKIYGQTLLRSYHVDTLSGRVEFIIDLFKILRWMVTLKPSGELEHLIPGVKRPTSNGHHITWMRAGLLKQFSTSSTVRLDLIRQIYTQAHENVEHGVANGTSVTITSIGKTFENAVRHGDITRMSQVIPAVREAIDAIHSLGIAHCDVCVDNLFVMDGGRVILGDLEYCTEKNNPPPRLRRFYNNADGKEPETAEELDENQFIRLTQTLNESYSLLASTADQNN